MLTILAIFVLVTILIVDEQEVVPDIVPILLICVICAGIVKFLVLNVNEEFLLHVFDWFVRHL